MISPIPGDSPPATDIPSPAKVSPISPISAGTPLVEVIPSPARVQLIPHHGFKIEDTVTLHNQGLPQSSLEADTNAESPEGTPGE
jgi:hypothetical protein